MQAQTARGETNPQVVGGEGLAEKVYDCAIVGGGPAGLSAAVYMGRLRRSAIVIDHAEGRSTWHQVNRNYPGFPDGIHSTALRELGREQAARYGVEFLFARAYDVHMWGEGRHRRFTLVTTRGRVTARTLILATGVTDRFPEFEGSEECIGRSMFWCIICDGYEAIGRKLLVLGNDDRAAALALQLLVFTRDVTLVAWRDRFRLTEERVRALQEHGVRMYDLRCAGFHCSNGQIHSVTLEDGTELTLDMMFVAQQMEPNNQLARKLNLMMDEHGFIVADSEQCTNVDGVYAAGDVTRLFNHQVTTAVHEGAMAAAAANYYLYEDWQKD
jgi:thioredoxin reductase (NADPH)